MRREPELVERHRRVVHALQSGGPAIPDSLLSRIEGLEARAVPGRRRLTRVGRPALAGGLAAVMAIVLVVVLSLTGPRGASTPDAALLSERPAERGATVRSFVGVAYPHWSHRFGWDRDGQRNDELGGRKTTTAFYRHTHHRIGYTVISGPAIEPPEDADVVTVNGVELHRFRLGEQDVVTFVRNGHTCVLSGKVHRASTLEKLASSESS
jgi:hypothetical protein